MKETSQERLIRKRKESEAYEGPTTEIKTSTGQILLQKQKQVQKAKTVALEDIKQDQRYLMKQYQDSISKPKIKTDTEIKAKPDVTQKQISITRPNYVSTLD